MAVVVSVVVEGGRYTVNALGIVVDLSSSGVPVTLQVGLVSQPGFRMREREKKGGGLSGAETLSFLRFPIFSLFMDIGASF